MYVRAGATYLTRVDSTTKMMHDYLREPGTSITIDTKLRKAQSSVRGQQINADTTNPQSRSLHSIADLRPHLPSRQQLFTVTASGDSRSA